MLFDNLFNTINTISTDLSLIDKKDNNWFSTFDWLDEKKSRFVKKGNEYVMSFNFDVRTDDIKTDIDRKNRQINIFMTGGSVKGSTWASAFSETLPTDCDVESFDQVYDKDEKKMNIIFKVLEKKEEKKSIAVKDDYGELNDKLIKLQEENDFLRKMLRSRKRNRG